MVIVRSFFLGCFLGSLFSCQQSGPYVQGEFPDIRTLPWKPLAEGVDFFEVKPGEGESPSKGDIATVHYIGWLPSGKKFDSSRDRKQAFGVKVGEGQVIRGWDASLLKMKKGSQYLIKIAPHMAYGNRSQGDIPANSVLIFDLKLFDFKKSPPTPSAPQFDTLAWKEHRGIEIATISEGSGSPALSGQKVEMHYTGWLNDGTEFDSSRRRGSPFSFKLGAGRVIQGWDIGVVGMKKGGRRYLRIPASLGYGDRGQGKIPPGATLVFEVERL